MKTLTVSALVCAMIALNRAAESHLVKREAYCSKGWTECSGRCFRYISTPMTWASAEKHCVSLGGNLASVHNILEYEGIQKIILDHSQDNGSTWIGGSDAEEEKEWFWSDGTLFSYMNWCAGEPNNQGGDQHCIQMNFSAQKCWDDVQCSYEKQSVCVKRV
ncbi:ladderlectin-like isoform 5-T5 [Lycodopsis pacificus]